MSRTPHETTDVCIIGAGPAGCVLAARLAQLGHAVCLVERATFPRRRLGESLSPGVLPLLETIGVRERVEEAGFRRVFTVTRQWEAGPEIRHDPAGAGLLVDRGSFDALLLEHARALGVRVLQPATLREQHREDGGWRLRVQHDGRSFELRCALLAHASGRAGARGSQRTGPRMLALYAYWRGSGLPQQPRIGAGPDEWFWGVPLPDGSYNTLIFIDAERLHDAPSGAATTLFHELIARSGLLDARSDARLDGAVRAADATPYLAERPVAPDTIRVGEAALALDPLSSSGVQSGIQSSLAGAIVVNTLLRRPASRAAAIRFYADHLARASARHRAWSAELYGAVRTHADRPFWRERAAGADPPVQRTATVPVPPAADMQIEISSAVEVADVPCLDAEFVTVRPALRHPHLDAPVAYLAGREVVPLLHQVRAGMTALEVARAWSADMPFRTSLAITGWLLDRGVLVPRQGAVPRHVAA